MTTTIRKQNEIKHRRHDRQAPSNRCMSAIRSNRSVKF